MRRFAFSTTIVLTGALSAQAAYDWHPYNGHQYALTIAYGNWTEAEAEAVAAGGHLATINDAAENAWLTTTFDESYSLLYQGNPWGNIAWIGYNQDTHGMWGWSNGESVTYTNYYSLFPQGGTHAYLHLANLPGEPSTWNAETSHDDPHHPTMPYDPVRGIIEVIPEPATLSLLALGGLSFMRRRQRPA